MKKEGSAEAALEKLQRLYSAFKFIEQRLTQKKTKLKIKLPEIEKTYNSLLQMEAQSKLGEPLTSHYELAQSIFAKAKINVHENDKARTRTRTCPRPNGSRSRLPRLTRRTMPAHAAAAPRLGVSPPRRRAVPEKTRHRARRCACGSARM